MTDYNDMLDLRMTTNQAKALYWLVGNMMTNEVAQDLGLSSMYDALRSKFQGSEVTGVNFDEWNHPLSRLHRDEPATVIQHTNPWDVALINVTGITD